MRRETKISVLEVVLGGVLFAIVAGGGYWIISNQLKKEDEITSRDYRTQNTKLSYEAKNRATIPKTQSIKEYVRQEIVLLEKDNKLIDTYNSIDLSKISTEEKEWLAVTGRKKLISEMRKDLAEETVKTIDDVCGLDKLSKKDRIFIYRIFNPIYNQIYERSDIFEMQK